MSNKIKDDLSIYGYWEPVKYKFKYLPVHTALLHTGKVLAFGGSGNNPLYLNNPFPAEIFEPNQIGKEDGKVYSISNEGIKGDIFCAGHAFLADGKLLVAGGTYKYDRYLRDRSFIPFSGLDHAYIFDPVKLSWKRIKNMKHGRWYPSCIMIHDGRIVTMAGLSKRFPWFFLRELEAFAVEKKEWQIMRGSNWRLPLYPRLHLLPNGDIFYAGSFNTHYLYPFRVTASPSAIFNINSGRWKKIGNPNNIKREEGTTVLLPLVPPDYNAKVLLIGGGTPGGEYATNSVEIIDFSKPNPQYYYNSNMKHARYFNYSVILPDKNILVVGGKSGKSHDRIFYENYSIDNNHGELPHSNEAILEPELYKHEEHKWYPMAHMKIDRLYHSNVLLLPDGRVLTAGSNPERNKNELRIEIYSPPYLFREERPIITKYTENVIYGSSFQVETPKASEIKSIVLIRPSVTTHCVNIEQRFIGLEFKQINSNTLSISIPSNKNIIPTGYYMLFILNEKDVPSSGKFVHIT